MVTGPWRIHLPSVSAAVKVARECYLSVQLALGDFLLHRLVTLVTELKYV